MPLRSMKILANTAISTDGKVEAEVNLTCVGYYVDLYTSEGGYQMHTETYQKTDALWDDLAEITGELDLRKVQDLGFTAH